MARKKKTNDAPAEQTGQPTEEPGYCIGHFDKSDKACEMCEIQDECRQLTGEIQDDKGEEDEDGEKEE